MEAFSGFLLDLYRLTRQCPAEEFQDQALGLLAGRIRFEFARWASSDMLPNGQREVRQSDLKGDPPEIYAAYREVMKLDWPMLDLLRNCTNRPGVMRYQSAALFAAKEMAAIRQYQRRFKHENTLMAVAKTPMEGTSHVRHMSLYRAHENHMFEDADVEFMRHALPHLLEAQVINAAVTDERLDVVGSPALSPSNVADCSGCLLSETPSLRALLLAEWPNWKGPRLPSHLWEGLCREELFRGKRIVSVARRVEDLMTFRVRLRCPADDLSPRELEVARRLSAGDSHKQLAQRPAIPPTTARNHVQRIHAKLGARNIADVVTALSGLTMGVALPPSRSQST